MRIFSRSETAALLPYHELVTAVESGIGGALHAPERQHHDVHVGDEPVRTLITMPAWNDAGMVGVKLVNVVPANSGRGEPSISASYVLFDPVTGRPMALFEGAELTARRTAAVAALAGKHLSNPDARVHLVVGAGAVSRHLAPAYATVRSFDRVLVWARRQDRAEELAEELRTTGLDAVAAPSLEAAVREADIVSCATLAAEPILEGSWLKAGAHVDLIGSYRPNMREADDEVLRGAIIYVDSLPGALTDAGELSDPIGRGVIGPSDIRGDLRALCLEPVSRPPGARSVFKSVGNARWDYLGASAAWQRASA